MGNTKPSCSRFRSIKLISNDICFGPCPNSEDEVEQHLRINADGNMWLSRYRFGDGQRYICFSKEQHRIGVEVANRILTAVEECFSGDESGFFVTDVGEWKMTIANESGEERCMNGALVKHDGGKEDDVSQLIRDALDMPELLLFDGDAILDRIMKFSVDYHRVSKFTAPAPLNENNEFVTWDYTEQLVIDRATQTLELIQNIGSGCQVKRQLHVEDGIDSLLDGIYEYALDPIEDKPTDAMVDTRNATDYRVSIVYRRRPERRIAGIYAMDTLPLEWSSIMDDITEFIRFYGMGEILDSAIYGKALRRQGDMIFVNVQFDEFGKTYCYSTEDEMIREGDRVVVPVGDEGKTTTAVVESVDYLPKEKAPIPLERIKSVIRKYSDDERNHKAT